MHVGSVRAACSGGVRFAGHGVASRLDITPAVPLPRRLSAMSLAELFALDIKPRGMVLDPIIPEKSLAMLYATRGTGKTHVPMSGLPDMRNLKCRFRVNPEIGCGRDRLELPQVAGAASAQGAAD
jgi:hypothetical protein